MEAKKAKSGFFKFEFSINKKESKKFRRILKNAEIKRDAKWLVEILDDDKIFENLDKSEKRKFLSFDLGRHYFKNLSLRRKKELLNIKY